MGSHHGYQFLLFRASRDCALGRICFSSYVIFIVCVRIYEVCLSCVMGSQCVWLYSAFGSLSRF